MSRLPTATRKVHPWPGTAPRRVVYPTDSHQEKRHPAYGSGRSCGRVGEALPGTLRAITTDPRMEVIARALEIGVDPEAALVEFIRRRSELAV